ATPSAGGAYRKAPSVMIPPKWLREKHNARSFPQRALYGQDRLIACRGACPCAAHRYGGGRGRTSFSFERRSYASGSVLRVRGGSSLRSTLRARVRRALPLADAVGMHPRHGKAGPRPRRAGVLQGGEGGTREPAAVARLVARIPFARAH